MDSLIPTLAERSPTIDNATRGPQLLAAYWTEAAVVILVLLTRFRVRWSVGGIWADDWIMAFTGLIFVIGSACVTVYVHHGGCQHMDALSPDQQINAVKWNWISQPFLIFCLGFGKASVAFLVLRLMGPSSQWRRGLLWFAAITSVLINVIGCILSFAQCSPPKMLWDQSVGGTCWDPHVQANYAIFSGAWNVFIDVLLAFLPLTIFMDLRMNLKKKLSLSILLGLSLCAAVCGAVKIKFLTSLTARSDIIWATYDLFAWTGGEIFVIIVCGCIPPLKPLYSRYLAGDSSKGTYGYGYGSQSGSSRPPGFSRQSASPGHRSKRSTALSVPITPYIPSAPMRTSDEELIYGKPGQIRATTDIEITSLSGQVSRKESTEELAGINSTSFYHA